VEATEARKHEDEELLLVRFSGDVTTKADATRRRFLQRMQRNIKDALRSEGIAHRVTRTRNRIFVALGREGAERGAETLRRVFGVQSLARVEEISWESLEDLVEKSERFFRESVRGHTFAVRARRVGDRHEIPVRSEAVQRSLGAALVPHARGVALDDPERTAALEIMPGRAYLFEHSLSAEGGLPLGSGERAVALLSGGFDSAVAAWLMMKRGVALDFVLCNLGGRQQQLETLAVAKVLADRWSYGTRPHLHAIDFDDVTRDLQAHVTPRFWQIVLKRLMMRAAEAVASERGAHAIVTGEVVAQVSSQTLPNLAVISAATPLPILRPLLGFNKDEIIALSRRIGTHDLSAHVGEYCALVPKRPATRSTVAQIEDEEADIDPHVLERAIAERSLFDLRTLDLASLERPDLQIDHVPDDAIVLDLRSKAAYQGWHYPGALFLDFANALRVYSQLDPGRQYVLYCEFGLKSGHLAELMRREGLRASHFAGGLKALIAWARSRGIPTPDL
jgi:thiamine biosynthesis protein ThiI